MSSIADEHLTDTVLAARDDARAQGSLRSEYMPFLPASEAPDLPQDVDPATMVWAETVAPGGYTHKRIARGTRVRFTDLTGEACAHVMVYNALEPVERLNVADTVKIPWQVYLTTGHPLLSGEGRVLATVDADTSKHHDSLCGASSDLWNIAKYGDAAPNGPSPSAHSLFAQAAVKHGLSSRDIAPSISFFKAVHVDPDGALEYRGSDGPSATVELIAEMPLLLLVANAPHPLDPRDSYTVGTLRIDAWKDHATTPSDPFFSRTPESERAYKNTADYLIAQGLLS